MSDEIGVVVLAAGKGTRMKMDTPKPLVPLAGRRLIDYPIRALNNFRDQINDLVKINVVVGHGGDLVKAHLRETFGSDIQYTRQKEQLGTGHAIKEYFEQNKEALNYRYTLIMCADTPLVTSDVLLKLLEKIRLDRLDAVCASFETSNPKGYGRILKAKKGFKIIEEKEASIEEKRIKEVNSGLYLVETSFLYSHLSMVKNDNKTGELYLTDIFQTDQNVDVACYNDDRSFLGVNDLFQLQQADQIIRQRKIKSLIQDRGVRFIDARHTYVDDTVEIREGSTIYPNTYIQGDSVIEKGVEVEMNCVIRDSFIKGCTKILANSYIEFSEVGPSCTIGPYARLRKGSYIGEGSKIGNFVETKNVNLDANVKVSHLSYVGDALIGEGTNVGCGFITCNYDGENKHQTRIGKNCFIGSDSQMIAPVEIGDECFIASGSTINKSMPEQSFAISRAKQETKAGLALKFLKKKS